MLIKGGKKMKGITPIISIIILLLITIGLAAAAWTFMGSYMSSITEKVIDRTTQKCITDTQDGSQDVMAIIHNIGTSTINIERDIVIMEPSTDTVITDASWTNLTNAAITEIKSGDFAKVTIDCCGGTGEDSCPKTCSFTILLAGRPYDIGYYCPGS